MTSTFKEILRSGQTKTPVQKGFSDKNWTSAWNKSSQTADCQRLCDAGKVIYEVLSEIRARLSKLYDDHAPKLSNSQLLKCYCALTNRDRFITHAVATSRQFSDLNIFSATFSNNLGNNPLTLMELADGAVDGMQKAISVCNDRLSKNIPLEPGSDPLSAIEFIKEEALLSHLYGTYEQYWQALVWGGYEFTWIDKEQKIADISQLSISTEIAHEISQIRRARLGTNVTLLAERGKHFFNDSYVATIGAGKTRRFLVNGIQNGSKELIHTNAVVKLGFDLAMETLPKSLIEKARFPEEISILDISEVFRIFVLLSLEAQNKFPQDDSIYSVQKFNEFCPTFNKNKLCHSISQATGLRFDKVIRAVDFLTYRDTETDIWCHPLLVPDAGQICLLTSALATPNYLRVLEHWLMRLEDDISEKGYVYEGNIIETLNTALKENPYLTDYDLAVSKRIKLTNGKEEEIDLLFRIGELIVIGEAKSVVSPTSPLGFYRTLEILDGAASQAQRKLKFVEENLENVMSNLGWIHDSGKNYKFTALVLNSNKMHAGFPVNGVPICDEKILTAYFEEATFPIFSTFQNAIRKDIAWVKFYSSADELEDMFPRYLSQPPQISEDGDSFTVVGTKLPSLDDGSLKLSYHRLIPKDISLKDRLNKDYCAPLQTVPDIEEEMSKVQIVI